MKVQNCRTEAVTLTLKKGATEAKEEWEDMHDDELAQGQRAPSKKFFKRQIKKFARFGTVENRVCTDWTANVVILQDIENFSLT